MSDLRCVAHFASSRFWVCRRDNGLNYSLFDFASRVCTTDRSWRTLCWSYRSAIVLRDFNDGPAALTDDVFYTASTHPDKSLAALHAYTLTSFDGFGCFYSQRHLGLRPPYGVVFDYDPFEDRCAVVVLWGVDIRYAVLLFSSSLLMFLGVLGILYWTLIRTGEDRGWSWIVFSRRPCHLNVQER